jgi:hypothetical protein
MARVDPSSTDGAVQFLIGGSPEGGLIRQVDYMIRHNKALLHPARSISRRNPLTRIMYVSTHLHAYRHGSVLGVWLQKA